MLKILKIGCSGGRVALEMGNKQTQAWPVYKVTISRVQLFGREANAPSIKC